MSGDIQVVYCSGVRWPHIFYTRPRARSLGIDFIPSDSLPGHLDLTDATDSCAATTSALQNPASYPLSRSNTQALLALAHSAPKCPFTGERLTLVPGYIRLSTTNTPPFVLQRAISCMQSSRSGITNLYPFVQCIFGSTSRDFMARFSPFNLDGWETARGLGPR